MKQKWIFSLINICSVLLIAASVFVLLTVTLTPAGQVPQVFGCSILRVLTGSMEPQIPEDAMILVREADPEEIQPGDIITFFSPDPSLDGALNTHRVQRVEQQGSQICFVTKGDANLLEDREPVSPEMVVGKVVFVSAGLGVLVRLLSNPLVFGLLIFVPLLVMLVMNLYHTIRTAAKLAREEEEEAVRKALEARRAGEPVQKGNTPE